MEEIEVVLERHEQQIKTLERDMTDMKTVQAEIRSMGLRQDRKSRWQVY